MRFLVIGGLLLLGGLGYAQAHIEARQRQALLDKNTTLEPAGGAPEPVQQSDPPSTMRRLSPALEKAPSAPTPQEETSPQPPHPSTERQLKPALEKAPFVPTPQDETSPQSRQSSTERQLKPALEKLTKPE
jgi:hypothetical protein